MAWSDIPGWTCQQLRGWYEDCAKLLLPTDHFVEIGVAYGASLAYLLDECGARCRVTGVDIWAEHQGREQLSPEVWARVTGHGTPIQACIEELRLYAPRAYRCAALHMATGAEAAALYADGSVSVVFIDEHHTFDSVTDAIKAWLPKVKPGGWLSGHDCNDHYPGVMQAVNALLPARCVFPPHPDDNGWGGVWTARMP